MNIKLDYVGAREIARKACLRATCFLGFGLNAARDDRLRDFSLSKEINVQFLPNDLTTEKIDEIKGEFEKWIIYNGLRELIEGFDVYLDRLYEYSLLASRNGQKLDESFGKKINDVKGKGLPGKQKILREEFGIASDISKHLKSIYEARNCMSHTRGMVTSNFCNEGDKLKVTWTVIELLVVHNDGREEIVEMKEGTEPMHGIGGNFAKRTLTRERIFQIGDSISFSVKDLVEICIFAYLGCDSFFFQALEFAKKNGVKEENEEVEQAERKKGSSPHVRY